MLRRYSVPMSTFPQRSEVDMTGGLSKKSLSFEFSLASSLRKVPSGTRGRCSITVGMYRAYGTVCKDALHQGALV